MIIRKLGAIETIRGFRHKRTNLLYDCAADGRYAVPWSHHLDAAGLPS